MLKFFDFLRRTSGNIFSWSGRVDQGWACVTTDCVSAGIYSLPRIIKMAETTLVFSASKTSFDPQVQGCLIIGQPRHLQSVSFDHFAEKLSRRVDSEVRSNFHWSWKAQFKSNSIFNFNFGISFNKFTFIYRSAQIFPQALLCYAAVNRPKFISL